MSLSFSTPPVSNGTCLAPWNYNAPSTYEPPVSSLDSSNIYIVPLESSILPERAQFQRTEVLHFQVFGKHFRKLYKLFKALISMEKLLIMMAIKKLKN